MNLSATIKTHRLLWPIAALCLAAPVAESAPSRFAIAGIIESGRLDFEPNRIYFSNLTIVSGERPRVEYLREELARHAPPAEGLRYQLSGTVVYLPEVIAPADGVVVAPPEEVAGIRRTDPESSVAESAPMVVREQESPVIDDIGPVVDDRRSLFSLVRPELSGYVRSSDIEFEDGEQRTALVSLLRSSFSLDLDQPDWKLDSRYNIEYGNYLDGSREDFIGHDIRAEYRRQLSTKNALTIAGSFVDSKDQRPDDEIVEDFNSQVGRSTRFLQYTTGIGFVRGSERDQIRHIVRYAFDALDFSIEGAEDVSGATRSSVGYELRYRANRRLTWFLDTSFVHARFENEPDNEEWQVLPGFRLLRSRRLTADVRGGLSRFQREGREPDYGAAWQLETTWRPARRATLLFKTGREFLEQPNADLIAETDFVEQTFTQGQWQQRWAPQWSSDLRLTWQQREIQPLIEDTYLEVLVGGIYTPTPRLTLRGDGVYTNRKSVNNFDYDRWTLTVNANLKF